MNLLGNNEGSKVPTEFKDPFKKDAVERVVVRFNKNKSMFRDGKYHEATVYFSNGNTKGEQEFFDDDPQELLKRVQIFVDRL